MRDRWRIDCLNKNSMTLPMICSYDTILLRAPMTDWHLVTSLLTNEHMFYTVLVQLQVKDVEEALIENAKEAERQRKFLEKESGGLKHRLLSNHTDVERAARARLRENSNLLYECNDLRYGVVGCYVV